MRPAVLLLALTVALPCAAPCATTAALAAPSPKSLVDAFFKAKKPDEVAKAQAAVDACPPLAPGDVPALREQILDHLAKRGRKLGSGRAEWFDAKKDGWSGLHVTSGKGSKGLVLALHGGGAGAGDCGQAESSFSGAISSLGMRGIYPEVLRKTEYGWTDPVETEQWVLELLRAGRRTWGTDPDRVYVTGHSMGGYGTWTYGAVHADLFAAGAAFAGAPTVYWKPGKKDAEAEGVADGILPNLRNLPLFVYQSTDDRNVPCAANQCAAAELAKLRKADPEGWEHVYEEVTGRGHDFPAKGPLPGMQWMAERTRNPRPAKVVWQPSRAWKTAFYWIRWTDPWIGSVLTATADRARNAIDVTVKAPVGPDPKAIEAERAAKTASLSFYLDGVPGAEWLDPTKEVVVTVDGKERARTVPQATLATLLRSAVEREDARYACAAEIAVLK
ncbi:MAG: hypothetical protein HMLKMBBP_02992 [Planctomycetes bacterium]|nr:hypothetical protein [Planctomycetota bacterium]